MFWLLSIFWFIRTAKVILFYLYLWQLKEYHTGRFLDHFRTEKGKKLLINKVIGAKLLILFSFLIVLAVQNEALLKVILLLLSLVYFVEVVFVIKKIIKNELKKPVLTKKTVFLLPSSLLVELLLFLAVLVGTENVYSFAFWLVLVDIFIPLLFSIVVLLFQIPTIIIRNQFILKKAREKRRAMENLVVVGITGSYAKTSTKEFLATILSSKFRVLKTSQHQNSEVGISRAILKYLRPEHQIFITEMGAYGRGGIKLLAGIAKPEIGILTGINEQHLALFKSQDNIIKTKYELIESLPKDGLAVFNGDNDYCLELYKKTDIKKKLYRTQKTFLGMQLEADIWAEDIKVEKEHISFRVVSKEGESADFRVNILGSHNIPNILAAVTVARALDMNLTEISNACWKIKPEQGSINIIKGRDDPYVLDATYSANPEGVVADLNYLKIWPGKKAIIMPCLIELGRASAKVHQRIGRKIAEVCDLAIITTKERFNEIKQGAVSAGLEERKILFLEEPQEIINQVNIFSSPGDAVLLEGRVPDRVKTLLCQK